MSDLRRDRVGCRGYRRRRARDRWAATATTTAGTDSAPPETSVLETHDRCLDCSGTRSLDPDECIHRSLQLLRRDLSPTIDPTQLRRYSSFITCTFCGPFYYLTCRSIFRLYICITNSHAHSARLFRPRRPCSQLTKSRPQSGCLAVTSSPPDSALTR